jgi:amino acid transporter
MEAVNPMMERHVDATPSRSTDLRRGALSAGFITLLVISAASPLSVVAGGFPIGMMLGNGAGTPALVILALGLLLLFAAGYTAMAMCVTSAGGFYAMIARAMGGRAGGASAMVAILGYMTLQFALYGLLGAVAASSLSAEFGLIVPWWACSLTAMLTVGWLGYRQIDFSAKLLAFFVVAEYAAVLFLDVLILNHGGAHGIDFKSFEPQTIASGNPFIGALFCFAAFIGFEATTIYSEEAKDPKRSIPIATYAALLVVGIFYSFSLWCMVLGVGSDKVVATITALSDPTNLLYVLSDTYSGPHLTMTLRAMFMVSIYAGLIAFHNSTARYFYAMGRECLLPEQLGWTHPIHKSPHVASVLQTVLCTVVITLFAVLRADPVLTQFAWLSNLATVCLIVLMIGTAISVVRFFRTDARGHGHMRVLVMPALACLGLCSVLCLAVWNFDVLTGASSQISWLLVGTVPVAAIIGWAMSHRLATLHPSRFANLGQDRN